MFFISLMLAIYIYIIDEQQIIASFSHYAMNAMLDCFILFVKHTSALYQKHC